MKHVLAILAVCVVFTTIPAFTQLPQTLSYQGLLTGSSGNPIPDGNYDLTFNLYTVPSGGTSVWTETHTSVPVTKGTFRLILGNAASLAGVDFNQQLYVGVTKGVDPEFSPRSALTSAPRALAPWTPAGSNVYYNTGNVGIGTTAPNQQLEITGNLRFPPSTASTGILYSGVDRYIHNYGIGNFFAGANAGNFTMSGNSNVGIGFSALSSNTTGFANTASGYQALQANTTGYFNTASGYFALLSNTTGYANTASGYRALLNNTTGYANTAIGNFALLSNTTGYENTANGYQALQYNTTGNFNTGNGYGTLYSNNSGYANTANGYQALYSNTIGFANTASGDQALRSNTTGDYNTASGRYALYSNTTGNFNTATGRDALYATTASDYNTALGYEAGNSFNNGYNNVFLGANVDVNAAGLYNVIAVGQATIVTAASTARFGNSATVSYGGWANWTNVSDGRYKKNVQENVRGIEFIKKLRPITYTLDATGLDAFYHRNESKESQLSATAKAVHERALQEKERIVYTGFVAQEVETAATELGFDFSGVDAAKSENDVYGLRYAEFVVPLVKAVQEQQKMIEALQGEINKLKGKREETEKDSSGEVR